MQRLKPSDPVLSVHDNERQTFSLRPDRQVRYNIQVQFYDEHHVLQRSNSGVLMQKFGLGFKTGTSKVTVEQKLALTTTAKKVLCSTCFGFKITFSKVTESAVTILCI